MKRLIIYRMGIIFFIIILINVIHTPGIITTNNMQVYFENSTICGYTTDYETGAPVIEVDIEFFIYDYQGNDYWYETWSDENGFYIIENVVAGYCFEYGAYVKGYHFFLEYTTI